MKRFFLAISFCVLGVFGLEAQKQDAQTITVGVLKGPTGVGLVHVVTDSPTLSDGTKVNCVLVPSVDLMLSKITTGEVDLAALPPNTAAKLYNGGVPYSLAAVIGDGMLAFLTTDGSIRKIEDLKGKTINASGQGSVPEFVMRYLLSAHRLDADKDLRLDYSLAYAEASAAIISGKISSVIIPEPFASLVRQGNPAVREPFDIQAEYAKTSGKATYPISVLVVKKKLIEKNPGAVRELLSLSQSSIKTVCADPVSAGQLVEASGLGIKAAVATISIPKANYVYKSAKDSRGDLENLFKLMLKANPASLGGKLPDDAFYAF
jgi:NitT/TauT family transport system substrate-binding protein